MAPTPFSSPVIMNNTQEKMSPVLEYSPLPSLPKAPTTSSQTGDLSGAFPPNLQLPPTNEAPALVTGKKTTKHRRKLSEVEKLTNFNVSFGQYPSRTRRASVILGRA